MGTDYTNAPECGLQTNNRISFPQGLAAHADPTRQIRVTLCVSAHA